MTTQELIKQLRSDAHYLANDEIAFNAVISKRIDLAVDCLKVLETQLIKTEEARQKQGKRLSEERKQKYDQITVIDELKNQLATVAAERDKAVEDLTMVLKDTDNTSICDFCEFYQPCTGKDCEFYEEGIGGTIDGKYYNFKWDCLDFDVCRKRENTPCEGCDFKRHFKWRGLGNESKTAEHVLKERS